MPLTPALTLTANLQDIGGNLDSGGSLVIVLCGYGQVLPRIAGTAMLAKIAPSKYIAVAGMISIPIWGNDVITPAGVTYYSVAVLDDRGNVVQAGMYQFTGSGTIDLSTAPQLNLQPLPPVPPVPTTDIYVIVAPSATPVFVPTISALITYDFTLTQNATASTMTGFTPGMLIMFILRISTPGPYTFAWGGNVKNAPAVNTIAGSVSTFIFTVDQHGDFYPQSAGMWN